jgi:hypothetical protein
MVRWWEMNYQSLTEKIYNYYYWGHEPSQPQLKLGSFNNQAKIARAKLARTKLARDILTWARAEPELSHELELVYAP